jgi:hypothetical protein
LHIPRRNAIRKTWLRRRRTWDHAGIVARFVLSHAELAGKADAFFSHLRSDAASEHAATQNVARGKSYPQARLQPLRHSDLHSEFLLHEDMVFLPVEEKAATVHLQALALFAYVRDRYDVDYLIKVDDESYVILEQLQRAVQQWHTLAAGACYASAHP